MSVHRTPPGGQRSDEAAPVLHIQRSRGWDCVFASHTLKFTGESFTRMRCGSDGQVQIILELLLFKPFELVGTRVTFLSWVIFQLGMAFVPSQWRSQPWDAFNVGPGCGGAHCCPFREEYSVEVQGFFVFFPLIIYCFQLHLTFHIILYQFQTYSTVVDHLPVAFCF